jgi:hypothetical protein
MNSEWRKSSHSSNGAECVEVGTSGDVLIRDTVQGAAGPMLSVSTSAWMAFLATL